MAGEYHVLTDGQPKNQKWASVDETKHESSPDWQTHIGSVWHFAKFEAHNPIQQE
jgi:hypothetical protein